MTSCFPDTFTFEEKMFSKQRYHTKRMEEKENEKMQKKNTGSTFYECDAVFGMAGCLWIGCRRVGWKMAESGII